MRNHLNLSIIFLCHNNRNINVCIDSVLEQMEEDDEIIVVDDHSDSDTIALLNIYCQNRQIVLLSSDKPANRSYNRNLGASRAKNEILVFLDGDMVLGNKGLTALRQAHLTRAEEAFVGQKHAINYDELQLNLYANLPNYVDMLRSYEGREQLEQNPLFCDRRKNHFADEEYKKYTWAYYYTGLCSISKSVFDEIGGFDEKFSSWGSEDVDLGFRISRKYAIGFINDLHGFHIPHIRDVIANEKSNVQNIKYMLYKYKTWEFEILDNFYGYGSLPVFSRIIQRMRLLTVSDPDIKISDREIIIDIISQQHPQGNIFYCENSEYLSSESMLGVTILKSDRYFQTAYVSDHIFIYPVLLTCRILQESLRIAKKVYIFPTSDAVRFPWEEEKLLLPKVQKQHYRYEINDLFAYSFKAAGKNVEVTYIPQLIH